MARYIIKRILLMIPVVVGVVILVFTILYFSPSDAAAVKLQGTGTAEQLEEMRESMGLNDPYIVQLGRYLYQLFIKFDFGTSLINGTDVGKDLMQRLPNSLIIALSSIVCSMAVGIPLGMRNAVKPNSPGSAAGMVAALIGISMPGFWFALLCVILFSYKLNLLPAYGVGGIQYWILPLVANSFHGVAAQARQTRSAMLDVINSDYIIMARAKGVPEKKVIRKHALPNALIPVITVSGSAFGSMIGGGLIIETIFNIPGIGYYLVSGVNQRDTTVVLGGVALLSIIFSFIMLLTDLAMAAVDPRIKAQFTSGGRRKKVGKHSDDK
ncbi:MAG: ABC transporter permease [Lachnospiraceae bacterium]|nr:ABC transporter permease [Lachnospiraceae bacterium]